MSPGTPAPTRVRAWSLSSAVSQAGFYCRQKQLDLFCDEPDLEKGKGEWLERECSLCSVWMKDLRAVT